MCTVSMTANQNITANFRNCNYSIEDNTNKNHGSDNSNGTIDIKAYPGCEWAATTNVDWLNINSSNGSGTGTLLIIQLILILVLICVMEQLLLLDKFLLFLKLVKNL
ncbi:MAG: hypothetical protein QM487_08740 [Candidatus Marithrix sp.]